MSKHDYKNFSDLSKEQEKVMEFVSIWVHREKTPVPRKEIVIAMKKEGMSEDTVKWSLKVLLAKSYLREGWTDKQNTTTYVQLRGI